MNKKAVILFSCLVLSGIQAHPARAADAPDNLKDVQSEAVELYQSGRYDDAIPLYRQIVQAHPDNKGALKDLLIALWLGEHYEEAADVGARLTHISEEDVDAQFMYARALLAIGQKEEALTIFKRCRELDPNEEHIQLATARVEGMMREYDSALAHMNDLKKKHPDYKELYPELARIEQITGAFGDAATHWAKAVDYFPDNRAYRFHEAECLYYSGKRDQAIRKLTRLAADRPWYWPAIDFLTDAALARGDASAAKSLLETHLQKVRPGDEFRLLKLIRLYQKDKQWDAAIKATDEWLSLNPRSGTALMLKAGALENAGRQKLAIGIYEQILEANPEAIEVLKALSRAQNAAGHPAESVATLDKAIALDPTDPYLLITKAYYQYEAGDRQAHNEELERWIKEHPNEALSVLLYHGLTAYPFDPVLAYSIHRSTLTFEDHIRALKEAHYVPVTANDVNAWIHGKGILPERPVFITFDDARMDSFQNGSPILNRYGMKAAMFAALVEIEGYRPKFASWKELAFYRDTERWDIQSHGDLAHEYIPVDDQGHEGLFLVNKKWLATSKRLESDDEWAARARKDYAISREKIDTRLGRAPRAYSFPEGNYGQDGISNATGAAAKNLAWTAEVYGSAYHEDGYGLNDRSRDPMHLVRYEPPAGQSGKSLVRHLTDDAPATLMIRRLLREAAWDRRLHEADHWMEELKKRSVSESCLWAEEARIRYAQGDWEKARRLAENAYREDPSAENQALLEQISAMANHFWRGNFAYQEDNRNRISRRFRQDLGFWHAAGLDFSLHHVYGSYSEPGVPTVEENGGGLGIARQLGEFHRLSLDASGHALSGSAKDTYSLTGALHSAWTENWNTDLEGGRTIYDTARALNANVINHFVDTRAHWTPQADWRASARARLEDLSDDNHRATGILEGGRRALLPRLWLVARATLDTTEHVSPNYYSPQTLQEYQLGPDYTLLLTPRATLNVVYLPGYGKEKTSDGEFVNDIDVTLNVALTSSLTFSPAAYFIRQPSYHRNTYAAQLSYRF